MTLKISVIWLLLVGGLFCYQYILQYIGKLDFYFLNHPDRKSLWLFVSYCTAFVLLLTLLLKGRYKKVMQIILVSALSFVAISYGSFLLGINVFIISAIVGAYAEEYLKFSSGNTLFLKESWTNMRDLIFFCILVALGFSMVENILYVVYNFIHQENVSLVNLTLWRGLISTLLHIVSTSLIAYITLFVHRKRNFLLSLLLGIVVWVGIHSMYNISLHYQLQYMSIPIIVFCFLILSYFLYQSDMLYEQSE